jgi:hypothetical protein
MRTSEENRKELLDEDEVQLEKHDMLAMWISGILTVGLPCLVLILLIVGVTFLFFGGCHS